ncbi:hypothetical protein MTO96_015021 [Rhipicephalus appendiculatus]
MVEESPPSSVTPVERPRRSLARTSSHRRSESIACTRMLWNIIGNANATRLRHEQAQRLCKVVSDQPTALHRPGPAAKAAAIARNLAISGAHCVTVSTAVSSGTSATLPTALPGVLGTVGRPMPSPVPTADSVASAAVPHLPCTDVSDPRNVPLPVDSELGPDDMDTTSTRKRSRPSESGSDDGGASRKLQAVATEHLTVTTPTTPSSDAVADEHSATHDADATNETDFQLVLSKSQKRRQRTATSPRPDTSVDTPPGTTTAAHPSFTRYVPACATQLSASQSAVVRAIAASDTIRPSASSPPACGTLWQRERRLATIKASAPTYLPHREAQAALRSSPSRTGGPPLNQAKGKSYAAAVGAPSKVAQNSTHPRQPGAEQRRPPSGPKKQGSVKPRPPAKATPESHLDQENTNLRLLLRAVADLLPPENQLRSICLQAAIDISLASEGAGYDWTTEADTWGSDHLPIVITPVGGRIPRTRRCSTVDWRAFRQQLQKVREDQDFLGLVAAAAQAATIQSRVPENHPVPDLRHLNLRAARRRAERRYLKAQCPEHRTLFNLVDAVCRRHANRRRRQSWQGICHSLSQARGGSKAWRLLRSLVIGTADHRPDTASRRFFCVWLLCVVTCGLVTIPLALVLIPVTLRAHLLTPLSPQTLAPEVIADDPVRQSGLTRQQFCSLQVQVDNRSAPSVPVPNPFTSNTRHRQYREVFCVFDTKRKSKNPNSHICIEQRSHIAGYLSSAGKDGTYGKSRSEAVQDLTCGKLETGPDYLGCLFLSCWHVRTGLRWLFTGLACFSTLLADAGQANLDAHLAARDIDDYA